MWSLFETSSAQSGYRLKTVEIFNWGTFHEGERKADIWKISPNEQNSLLTGANGSGKTTLVDAMLALLVNPQKRYFNQSSGALNKKDRSEETYVEGHYGRTQGEEQQNSKIEKLRPNRAEVYSIILGVFINKSSVPITLIQVRWFNNSGLQRKYIVAKMELSIAEHIQFSSDGNWLRKLKRQYNDRIEDFDSFPKYAGHFQRLFGMKSDKALTLFNQTVGMKVLGNLDEFIRINMLEESTAEADFAKLMEQYQTLLVSFQALEKARIQLDLLKPIHTLHAEYIHLKTEIDNKNSQKMQLEPWFAKKIVQIWQNQIKIEEQNLDGFSDKLGQQENTLESLRSQKTALEIAKSQNSEDIKIKDLESKIKTLENTKKEKEAYLKEYNQLARKLDLIENPDEGVFTKNLETASILESQLIEEKNRLNQHSLEESIKENTLKVSFENLKTDIHQLENSSNKITGRVAEIHQAILDEVGANRSEIPFIAELIQVKVVEKSLWNAAIEKLLHGFGLGILVPQKYYSAVNQYIHSQRDLRGKIKYHLVGKVAPSIFQESRKLVGKLEFNAKSPYVDWLENRLTTRFDYACVENQTDFERHDKAILPSGLSKNKDSHERDDSQHHRPILGWDNKELLRDLKQQAFSQNEEITKIGTILAKNKKLVVEIEGKMALLAVFKPLKQYSKLDWQSDAVQITELQNQKTTLINSNIALKTMEEQLKKLEAAIKELDTQFRNTDYDFKETEKQIAKLKEEAKHQQLVFENHDVKYNKEDLKTLVEGFDEQLNFQNFTKEKKNLESKVDNDLAELNKTQGQQELKIRSKMSDFKSPSKEIKTKFTDWESDTYNLKTEIDQLPEYIDRYEQIKNENLAELENRFRDEFKSGVTKALSDFVTSLEIQHEKIEQAIEDINDSLHKITFNINPDTYIQLERKDTTRPMIRDFRYQKMNSWQPDRTKLMLSSDQKEAEIEHFTSKIQPFIKEMQDNEKWRQEVTDVRNWSDFKAREYYRADKKTVNVYESSSSLSGGEAAQLTYTVLCASLAHQFGITKENNNKSFRLVVVDEAFSKLDDNKSEYLLRLCRNLGLQLMAVTPLTSVHLVENDVSVIHWVTKSSKDKRKSTVRDITIMEYKEKKEILLAEEA